MARRIEKILVRHFRGATKAVELSFDTKKPMVMIFGENGTGKSTLVDSIDLVCNESGGSIRERASTDNKQLASLGHSSAEVGIDLVYNGQTWKGSLGAANRPSVIGTSPKPPVFILRRSQVLRLMESGPSERYEVLQGFLSVAGVEASESTLNTALKEAKKSYDAALTAKTTAEKVLDGHWKTEGHEDADAKTWAAKKTADSIEGHQRTAGVLTDITGSIKGAINTKAALAKAIGDEVLARNALEAVQEEIQRAEAVAAGDAIKLIDLLRRAQEYIGDGQNIDACPVCTRAIAGNELASAIADRLAPMTHLRSLQEKLQLAQKGHHAAVAIANRAENDLIMAGKALAGAADKLIAAGALAGVETGALRYPNSTTEPSEEDKKGQLQYVEDLIAAWGPLSAELDGHLEVARKAINQFNLIKNTFSQMTEASKRSDAARIVYERLTQVFETVRSRRHNFLQSVLDSAKDECNRLYAMIHPDEPIALSSVTLKPGAKAALTQEASIDGHEKVAPQAYFSESHLDTLGFCLWLAVARLHCQSDGVIVLDDVFTSVDAEHFSRIIDLLSIEGPKFSQMIITTHSRHWFERVRIHQQMGKNVDLVRLHRWASQHGVRHDRAKLAVEELAEKLDAIPFDRQGIASQAGILLEGVLELVARQYRCRLPVTPTNLYTLGDLLGGMAQIKDHAVHSRQDVAHGNPEELLETITAIKPLIEKLNTLAFIRNEVGAHFNLHGADVPDSEVERFGRLTIDIVSALTCAGCGDIPRREKGTHWTCACASTRMTPLKLMK